VWGWPVSHAEESSVQRVGPFSEAAGDLPQGWAPLHFPKIPRHTRYDVVKDGERWVVRARSEQSASGLRRELALDVRELPILRWSWKVDAPIAGSDPTKKSGDDYAARLYVTFRYEPDRVGFWKRTKYRAARALLGDLPIGALTYIWSGSSARGSVVDNPYAGSFVKMVVVQSGSELAGHWQREERDLYRDYVDAFGEEPPLVSGIAIMTDTDNTGSSATAWYGDIEFARR
jgi:hypothetical protein